MSRSHLPLADGTELNQYGFTQYNISMWAELQA